MNNAYDVVIVGAGPAGASCATFLGMAGHKVLLIDKAHFPRDKTCGDAISGSLRVHEELNLTQEIKKIQHAPIHRAEFSAPNGKVLNIPFKGEGYVCKRVLYDHIVFEKAKQHAETLEDFTVTELLKEDGKVTGVKGKNKEGQEMIFHAKLVIGADGAMSLVAKQTGLLDNDPKHTITAVRCYYKNVKNVTDAIELHFVDDIIPGYFWVFPAGDNEANVGLGMVNEDFKKKDWKMTDKMFEIVKENPLFKERFAEAELVEGTVKGWGLPVGSKRRKAHGDGFILIGDAAGLIDPFTGEGIANAMRSGKIGATWADAAIKAENTTEAFLKQYEDAVWEALGPKLRSAYKLQKLGKNKWLTNRVVSRAAKSKDIQDMLRLMVDNSEERKRLANPITLFRIIVG